MLEIFREDLLNEVKKIEKDLIQFTRELIEIPAESGTEENIAKRITKEMEIAGFDEIKIDKMGNVIGRIGSGKTVILMDAHIDTVGTGDIKEWKFDPYKGKVEDGKIFGRGSSDQLAGMSSLVYAGKLIKKLNLLDDYTLYISGTCHEEACEGLSFYHMINDEKLFTPDYVLLSEPTNLRIARGQPGRMELRITTKGKACHSSVPDNGINAIYKMQPIIKGIEELHKRLHVDEFMGKGTIAVTNIRCLTPSSAAIPDECSIDVDRRLTVGETRELVLDQLNKIIASSELSKDAFVEVLKYEAKAWTGETVSMEKYFPGWVLPEDHILTQVTAEAAEFVLNKKPKIDKWAFSTNAIASMGTMNIPSIGFGPADDLLAHTVDECVPIDHLIYCTALYAILPKLLVQGLKKV